MGHMDDASDAAQHGQLPEACTLGASDGPTRLHRWQHLQQVAGPTHQRRTRGPLPTWPRGVGRTAGPGRRGNGVLRVCQLVVTEDGGQPVLRVTAPLGSPQDIEPIAAMFAVTL